MKEKKNVEANIFNGLEKSDDVSLQFQIAILSETIVTNVTKEMGQKATCSKGS